MSVESATSIDGLDPNSPPNSDFVLEGAAQIRLVKSVLQLQFVGSTGDTYDIAVDVGPIFLNGLPQQLTDIDGLIQDNTDAIGVNAADILLRALRSQFFDNGVISEVYNDAVKAFATEVDGVAIYPSSGVDNSTVAIRLRESGGIEKALIGFPTSDELRIINEVNGGNTSLAITDGGGTPRLGVRVDATGETRLYFAGGTKLLTQDENAGTNSTAAALEHRDGNSYEVGLGDLPALDVTGNLTLSSVHKNKCIQKTGAGDATISVPAGLGANFVCNILRWGTGQLSIAESGVSLRAAGIGALTGPVTIPQQYGMVSIYMIDNTNGVITGTVSV